MSCLHLELENVRPWPGENFSIGECTACGSTRSVPNQERDPNLNPDYHNPRLEVTNTFLVQLAQHTRHNLANDSRIAHKENVLEPAQKNARTFVGVAL